MIDSNGRFLDVNDAACAIIGYSREELLSMKVSDVEAMESPEYVTGHIRRVKETGYDRTLKEGEYVRVSVEDRGIGIPEEHLNRIFDPFFTTKQKGSGLGLATSYSIINKHDGLITVRSTPGFGTNFDIYLPASDKEVTYEASYNNIPVFGKGKILVMDDEEIIRRLLKCFCV